MKQEERLRAVAGQHEGLGARVQAQELDAEQRLDALDAALQVGFDYSLFSLKNPKSKNSGGFATPPSHPLLLGCAKRVQQSEGGPDKTSVQRPGICALCMLRYRAGSLVIILRCADAC